MSAGRSRQVCAGWAWALAAAGLGAASCEAPSGEKVSGSEATAPSLSRARELRDRRTSVALRAARVEYARVAVLERDPAEAHAGDAVCSCLLALYGAEEPVRAFTRAGAEAAAALALDPRCGEALAAEGLVAFLFERDFQRSDLAFERASRERPDLGEVHHWWAMSLLARARGDAAVGRMARARELEPRSRILEVKWGVVLDAAGRSEEALRHLDAVVAADPGFGVGQRARGLVLLRLGRAREAASCFERAWEGGPPSPVSAAGACYAWAQAADLTRARQWGDRVIDGAQLEQAMVACAFGRWDAAVRWIDRAIEAAEPSCAYLATRPWFTGLHGHEEFPRLLRRLGLGEAAPGPDDRSCRAGTGVCGGAGSPLSWSVVSRPSQGVPKEAGLH